MSLLAALLAAVGLVLVASGAPARRRTLRRRVEPYVAGVRARSSRLLEGPAPAGLRAALAPVVARVAPTADRTLERRLAAAGGGRSVADFRLEQLSWAGGFLAVAWAVVLAGMAVGAPVDLRALPVLSVLVVVAGWLGRDWWLGREVARRCEVLEAELPTAIDLLTLSVTAGESVPAAFERVAGRVGGTVGAELDAVVADVRAGEPIAAALEGFVRRLPTPGAARLVDALVTALERGTPLADTLRAQAEDARAAGRRALLEAGGRREVLMLVPVVFLIMPVVVVFALLPGLVSLDLLVP